MRGYPSPTTRPGRSAARALAPGGGCGCGEVNECKTSERQSGGANSIASCLLVTRYLLPALRRSSIPARTCAVIAATCSPPATAIPPTSQGSPVTSHLRSPPYLPGAAPASRRPGVALAPAAGLPLRAAGRSAAHIAHVFAMRGRRAYGAFRDGATAIVKGRSRASLSSQDSGNRLRAGRSWLPRAVP